MIEIGAKREGSGWNEFVEQASAEFRPGTVKDHRHRHLRAALPEHCSPAQRIHARRQYRREEQENVGYHNCKQLRQQQVKITKIGSSPPNTLELLGGNCLG